MITVTIFPKSLKIYTRGVYYFNSVGFLNSDEKPNYRKIHNVIQDKNYNAEQNVEFFFCDDYLNVDFFKTFIFLKKIQDFVFVEFDFENEKEFSSFLRTNPAFHCQSAKRRIMDNNDNICYCFDISDLAIVCECDEVELL